MCTTPSYVHVLKIFTSGSPDPFYAVAEKSPSLNPALENNYKNQSRADYIFRFPVALETEFRLIGIMHAPCGYRLNLSWAYWISISRRIGPGWLQSHAEQQQVVDCSITWILFLEDQHRINQIIEENETVKGASICNILG